MNFCLLILIIIIMQLHSSQQSINDNDCIFCDEKGDSLTLMMNQALMAKHTINQSEGLIGYIDVIMRLQQPCNAEEAWAAHQFRQYQVSDQIDEFLKRQYAISEFQGKINMLTEYYKFHADVPRVVELGIQKILGKYYDKKRQYDYKKIKRILKEEQGLSITSVQESESSFDGTEYQKRSRYSTLLQGLEESKVGDDNLMSDSKLLKEMCKVIEKALPTTKLDKNFQIKGSYTSINQDKVFEEYLKQQQRRMKQKVKKVDEKHVPRTRFNLQDLLKKREKVEKQKQKHSEKQRDTVFRDSRQLRKKDKDNKYIYNTNIKIQIKNALFCPPAQPTPLNIGNIQYENGNKQVSKFSKKSLINQVNYVNHESNKKLIAQIYKSTHQDLKKRIQNNSNHQNRLTTKQSINRSQSKDKKKSLTKGSTNFQSNKEMKKHTSGSNSARRLPSNNQLMISTSKVPVRSTSASNLKKRSYSSNNSGTITTSASSLPRKTFEKRPIESISKYGSYDMRQKMESIGEQDRQKRSISIKELLNRKLTFKKE